MSEKSDKPDKVTKLGQIAALGNLDDLKESAADKAARARRALSARRLELELLMEERCKFARKMRLNPKVFGVSPWYRPEDWVEGDAKDRDTYVGPPDGPAVVGNLGPALEAVMRGVRSAAAVTKPAVTKSPVTKPIEAVQSKPVNKQPVNKQPVNKQPVNKDNDRKEYMREYMRKVRAARKVKAAIKPGS